MKNLLRVKNRKVLLTKRRFKYLKYLISIFEQRKLARDALITYGVTFKINSAAGDF